MQAGCVCDVFVVFVTYASCMCVTYVMFVAYASWLLVCDDMLCCVDCKLFVCDVCCMQEHYYSHADLVQTVYIETKHYLCT